MALGSLRQFVAVAISLAVGFVLFLSGFDRKAGEAQVTTEPMVKIDDNTELLRREVDPETGATFSYLHRWGYTALAYRTEKARGEEFCGGYGIPVVGEVPSRLDLADELVVHEIVEKAEAYAFRICPGLRAKRQEIWIALYPESFDKSQIGQDAPIFIRFNPDSTSQNYYRHSYRNRIVEQAAKRRAAAEEERKREEEQRKRAEEAQLLVEKEKAGEILALPEDAYLYLLARDSETGTKFWSYSQGDQAKPCWSPKYFGGPRLYAEVPRNVSLLNENLAKSLIMKAEQARVDVCRDSPMWGAGVFLIPEGYDVRLLAGGGSPQGVLVSGNVSRWRGAYAPAGPPQLKEYQNHAAEADKNRRKIEAHRAEEARKKERLNEFLKKHGVTEWPSREQLAANPFVYQGKTVIAILTFKSMVSATEGIFVEDSYFGVGDGPSFWVSNVPSDLFRARTRVLLAAKVLGKTAVGNTHLRFVGAHFCRDFFCKDMLAEK